MVSWTADEDAPRSVPMSGSAGRYISMVKGPRATIAPSTRITRRLGRVVVRSAVGAARSSVSVTEEHSNEGTWFVPAPACRFQNHRECNPRARGTGRAQ
jgi:hypothetical protein